MFEKETMSSKIKSQFRKISRYLPRISAVLSNHPGAMSTRISTANDGHISRHLSATLHKGAMSKIHHLEDHPSQ